MYESSVYRGILGDGERKVIFRLLRARFGPDLPEELVAGLNRLEEPDQLEPLADLAATCTSLDEFRAGLPAPRSPRRRPRSGNGR
jgi:hypothetical protein